MLELAPRCAVILLNRHGERQLSSPQALLPHGFGAGQLDEARH
jgi:hypothetical protein